MNRQAVAQAQPKIAAPIIGAVLQRKCACGQHTGAEGECEKCRKKKGTLQRKAAGRSPAIAPPVVHEALRSSGRPLDPATQSDMERSLGADFSGVRVHTDSKAGESARALNALAYTVGRDLVFGAGQYRPGTRHGDRLIAHELSHVVQQRGSAVSGFPAIFDSPAHEAEAERAAGAAAGTRESRSPVASLGRAALQRAKDPEGDKPEEEAEETKKPGEREQEFPGVAHAVGQDPAELLRIDTVTVIELGANDWCDGCVRMRQDLSELVSEINAKPQRLRFRVFSLNEEVAGNEEVARRMKKRTGDNGVPQTFVYVDNQLVNPPVTFSGYEQGGRDYKEEIRGIYDSAASRSVYTGMKWGAGIGAAIGGVAGTIAGGVIGGVGGGVLGGVLGSAAGALIGLGIGTLIGAIFGKDKGTAPLSKEQIEKVQRFQQGLLGASEVDNDLARDVATYFADNVEKGFVLDPAQRRTVLKVLLSGSLDYQDQRAVIKIIENSNDADILRIFAADEELRLTDLAEKLQDFSKDERQYLTEVLNRLRDRFPLQAPKAKTEGLLIEDGGVRAAMRSALIKGNAQTPGKKPILRECCGVFYRTEKTAGVQAQWSCLEATSCPVGEIGKRTLEKGNWEPVILGSFHTHPNSPPQCKPREAPSRADFESFMPDPLRRGGEHYVVGSFNVYLILFDGSFRILGNTPELLGVPPAAPAAGAQSTLELEYSPIGKAGVKGECP